MIEQKEEKQWHVLQAKFNGALKAQKLFNDLGVDCYVPMEVRDVTVKGMATRRKLMPIFQNIIFADITEAQLREIRAENSYLWCLSTLSLDGRRTLMTVPRKQMQTFIDFVGEHFSEVKYLDVASFDLKKGERVRITEGLFAGKEGTFVKVKGKRSRQIVVAIDGLIAVSIAHKNPAEIVERI